MPPATTEEISKVYTINITYMQIRNRLEDEILV